MDIKRCYKCSGHLETSQSQMHGLHESCFREWFILETDSLDFQQVVFKGMSGSSPALARSPDSFEKMNKSFFHGRYKKYSAELGEQSHILKVQDSRFPFLPATEYLCNQIGQSLKINVPRFYYIRFQNTLDTFVTRNFMRDFPSATLNHIYTYLTADGDFNCKSIIEIIEKETGRIGEVEKFIELCLFDALIGNHDRHGRNLALIVQSSKGARLAPFYDNPSFLGIEDEAIIGAQFEPKGKIFTTESNEPGMKDYVREFKKLMHEDAVMAFYKKIDIEHIDSLVEAAFMSEARKAALQRLIARRYGELKHEVHG
jgi:hypothetical protein